MYFSAASKCFQGSVVPIDLLQLLQDNYFNMELILHCDHAGLQRLHLRTPYWSTTFNVESTITDLGKLRGHVPLQNLWATTETTELRGLSLLSYHPVMNLVFLKNDARDQPSADRS